MDELIIYRKSFDCSCESACVPGECKLPATSLFKFNMYSYEEDGDPVEKYQRSVRGISMF